MTKNRTPTPVYLDPGMHPGLEVKGLKKEVNVPEPSVQLTATDKCMATAQADKRRPGIFGKFKEIYHPHYSRCLPIILCFMIQLEKIHPKITA